MESAPELIYVSPNLISPCPYQTRLVYKRKDMEALIASIKENGILQPLIATKTEKGYQLISGHRRLYAAKMLELERVPLVVMEKTDTEIAVLCTVENLHREDLNFFEQAEAIRLLCEKLGLTQTQAGQKLSLSQSAVANKLKVLTIEEDLRQTMIKANFTERHARAVCRLDKEKQPKAVEYIIKHSLNVAETDKYIEKLISAPKTKKKPKICIKDVRIFKNTITKAVKLMKTAGFDTVFEENTAEDSIEYRIVIPLKR